VIFSISVASKRLQGPGYAARGKMPSGAALYQGPASQAAEKVLRGLSLGSAARQRRVQVIHFLSFRAGFSRRGICGSDFFRKLFSRAVRDTINNGL